jgi:CRISPR-associated endoribonuclease Cas6
MISFSSIVPDYVKGMANNLLLNENLTLNNNRVFVETVEFAQNKVSSNRVFVKALSPITVYSTYEKRDGSKITHYFSPRDKVFEHLIEENFARKFQAYTGGSLDDEKNLISIRPVRVTDKNKVVTKYKSTWITGWTGIYELKGKEEYLTFLINTGAGSKNSSGFGYIAPCSQQDEEEVLKLDKKYL